MWVASDVAKYWGGLSFQQRKILATATINPGSAFHAWDLVNFNTRGFESPPGTGRGWGTATVGGSVFDEQAVNYWLAGVIYREIDATAPDLGAIFFDEVLGHAFVQWPIDVPNEKWQWFIAGSLLDTSYPSQPTDLDGLKLGMRTTSPITWQWCDHTSTEPW